MHYIGMDCHIATLDFAVVNDAGRLVKRGCVPTGVNGFMEFVKAVPTAFFGVNRPGFRRKPAGLSEQSRPPFRTKSATL